MLKRVLKVPANLGSKYGQEYADRVEHMLKLHGFDRHKHITREPDLYDLGETLTQEYKINPFTLKSE